MRARRPLALAATGLAIGLTLAACSASAGPSVTTTSAAAGSATQAGTGTGTDAEISFAQLMVPHHQQAVEMADLALSRSTNPEVKKLAEQIKAAQDQEMAQMKGWLSAWGAPEQMDGATASDGSMDHSGMDMGGMTSSGMMTADDLAKLKTASGADFDRMWLQMMIAHHQGAISMANQVIGESSNPQVTQLAKAVVAGQTQEISTMQQLLAG